MKVLIYGYGWCGQSIFSLLQDLGIEARVVDDGLDFDFTEDFRFITYKQMLKEYFDIYLICAVEDSTASQIFVKLQHDGIEEQCIKRIQTDQYKTKMAYLLKTFFTAETLVQDFLQESYTLPQFHNTIQAIQSQYFSDKKAKAVNGLEWKKKLENKMQEKTIFSKLRVSSLDRKTLIPFISYPGFNIGVSEYKKQDKDFYFIENIDFNAIRNRPKEVKLIACFGNSALRVEYLPIEESITKSMQKELNAKEFLVLNFGVTGYTLYEQMMLYVALVDSLKPEIVLTFFGGTDWRCAPMVCERMLKEHKINYTPWWYERSYKEIVNSELPLYVDFGTNPNAVNVNIAYTDANEAMRVRLEQFKAYVSAGGGGYFLPLSSRFCLLRTDGVRKSA